MKIIAYGSLLNKSSLEATLGRRVVLKRIVVPGYKRVFNAPFGGYAFMNLEKSPGSQIEAAYFEVDWTELVKFSEREAGSKLLEILPGYWAFMWPRSQCRKLPVLQSYIEFCLEGCRLLNVSLWSGTKKPDLIIDDSQNSLY